MERRKGVETNFFSGLMSFLTYSSTRPSGALLFGRHGTKGVTTSVRFRPDSVQF